jgi:hypothetical protein
MINNFNIYHSDWNDICLLTRDIDIDTNKIINKIVKKNDSDSGTYYLNNDNELLIEWDNSNIELFVYIYDGYYEKNYFNNYIKDYNLLEIQIFNNSINTNTIYFLNIDKKIIFQKLNLKNIGSFKFFDNFLIIKWYNNIIENYIKINNIYYSDKYLLLQLDKFNNIINEIKDNEIEIKDDINEIKDKDNVNEIKDNEIEIKDNVNEIEIKDNVNEIEIKDNVNEIEIKDKKNNINFYKNNNNKTLININNDINYFYYNNCERFILKNNKYYYIKDTNYFYNFTNIFIDKHILKNNLNDLVDNNLLINKNYINKNNIINYLNYSEEDDINYLEELINIALPFEIKKKEKKRMVSLVEWGYPPFGGGENWLLNFNKNVFKNNYENFLICFSDPFKNEYFSEINKIDLEYVIIIQMPKDLLNIIKVIQIIQPDLINHQGANRELFMKISNLLQIPFLTGFCFWNNIIKFNKDNINVDMINNNNLIKADEFSEILNNCYTYSSSNFVNDIINKVYDINLDVIETISLEEEYSIKNNMNKINKETVTLINCHYNKGGYLVEYLCKNLDISIPLQFVYTENDPNIPLINVKKWINERNKKNNINILIKGKIDIREIYSKTKILLIPSICDETFCRVGYEGMMNNIPIISSNNGNLKYLLKDYAIFIESIDKNEWLNKIHDLYFDPKCFSYFNTINTNLSETLIENKIMNKINSMTESKYKLNQNNIGLIVPWADQGLGIQSRDYYISFKKLGYNPHVLSFKPYHATHENIYLQTFKEEWNYKNIQYSPNYREDIDLYEILDFIYKYNIKSIVIIEATFLNIFKIALFLKLLKINIYLVVNIECIRLVELKYHNIFDKIFTNNQDSFNIIKQIFPEKGYLLNFHLNHPFFQKKEKKIKKNFKKIKFCCFGGLNSISRKNIDKIIQSFYSIYENKIYLNWELNVYIQGVEIPDIIKEYNCPNIIYNVNNLSYSSIVDKYYDNDILIHLGSHEGLGLGFYEALYTGTPILTLNWTPNNEIIQNNINGWIIDSSFTEQNDNNESLIHMGVVNINILESKIIEILSNTNNTLKIINSTIQTKSVLFRKNKNIFEKNIIEYIN